MAFKLRSGNSTTFKNMGTSPFKDMKTGKYEHSFESPAKQWKGTEGQDQDKIFNKKGEHVGDWVNGKKVMHVQKDPKDTSIKGGDTCAKCGASKQNHKSTTHAFTTSASDPDWEGGDTYDVKPTKKKKSPAKHTDTVNEGSNRDPQHAAAHNKRHTEGDTHGEIGSKDNKWVEKTSPAKQYAAGGTKKGKGNIFTKRGRKQRQLNKYAKEVAFENYEFNQAREEEYRKERDAGNNKKSPAKQTDSTYADGSKKSKREQEFSKRHTAEKAKDKYWYKIDGKPVTKSQYLKYENKPGNMEGGGKTTNHPDVYGKIASNFGRGPKNKKK